jgi:hypothetical protein
MQISPRDKSGWQPLEFTNRILGEGSQRFLTEDQIAVVD